MLYWPRVKNVTVDPGIRLTRAGRLRVETGSASRTSRVATNELRLLTTSTTGVSPVTVIDSSMLPICISAFTWAINVPSSATSVRRTVLKPGSVKVTA